MKLRFTALYFFVLFGLAACSGSDSSPPPTPPSSSSNEYLFFIDQPSISAPSKNLYQVDPENSSNNVSQINQNRFTQYASHPALPNTSGEYLHSIAWIENDVLWAIDSSTNTSYPLAKSNTIENTCSIDIKATMRDGSQNFVLLRDKGSDGRCSGDDNFYRVNYKKASSTRLNQLSETTAQGLLGGVIISNASTQTYSTFVNAENLLLIYNQANDEVTAQYDIEPNIHWGPSTDKNIYAIISNELHLIPFEELVSGQYSFTSGISVDSNDYELELVNSSLYLASPKSLLKYEASNKTLSKIADLSFSSVKIITVTDTTAYLMNRDNGETYIFSCDLETGHLKELMSSIDSKFSAFYLEGKLWASDYAEATIYQTESGETTNIEKAKFSLVGRSGQVDIALIKSPWFNNNGNTEGYISKYNASTGEESLNYGAYQGTPLSLGWHGNQNRLAIDSDYFKIHLLDFDASNSLTEIFESSGIATLPF